MVIFVALVCLLAHHALAITELTDANFYDYAKEKDVLLVNFYAPWCGDCKNLAPDLETAASTLGTRGLDLAKVDCFGAGKGLCDTYGIKRWPTLKNFNRGSYTGDYNGGLTSNEIAGYIATVENSIAPANPYAMAIPPPVTQACMAKCHIAKITNKQPCYSKCKTKNFATHNGVRKLAPVKFSPPKPIINEHSCAKCRIPQPPGKLSPYCELLLKRSCIGTDDTVGNSGLPRKTELIMNSYIKKAKHLTDFFKKHKSNGVLTPTLTVQLPYDSDQNYEMFASEFTFMHTPAAREHKHAKTVNSLTPSQALRVPYGLEDKKAMLAKRKRRPPVVSSKKGHVVNSPPGKGTNHINSKKMLNAKKGNQCGIAGATACYYITDYTAGYSGLPKITERRIMNTFFHNIIKDYFQKTNANPLLKLNAQVGNDKYGLVAKAFIGDHQSINLLTPTEAMHLGYGRSDKKDTVVKRRINHKGSSDCAPIGEKICTESNADTMGYRKLLSSYMNNALLDLYKKNKPNILLPSTKKHNESSGEHNPVAMGMAPKHNVSTGVHKHTKVFDALSPYQALQLPYGLDDKKGIVVKTRKRPQVITSKKAIVVKLKKRPQGITSKKAMVVKLKKIPQLIISEKSEAIPNIENDVNMVQSNKTQVG